jgi:hypothetical protein
MTNGMMLMSAVAAAALEVPSICFDLSHLMTTIDRPIGGPALRRDRF